MQLQTLFDQKLRACEPFESQPHLAVATSGGSDSLALVLLAADWAHHHQGQITALIVDHRLSPASENPLDLQQQLKAFDISSVILPWSGLREPTRLQERARHARYQLMMDWCAAHHVLHLLLGHHRNDQQETFLWRESRQSDALGLASMAFIVEKPQVRLLRPLLTNNKKELSDYLIQRRVTPFQDPSNQSLKFSRNQVRAIAQKLTCAEKQTIDDKIQWHGFARQNHESEINILVARLVTLYPEGYGRIDQQHFDALLPAQATDILKRCLMTFGTKEYSPSRESLQNCYERSRQETVTLQGCIVFRHCNHLYIAREPYRIKPVILDLKCSIFRWDYRFKVTHLHDKTRIATPLILRALGQEGLSQWKDAQDIKKLNAYPQVIKWGLPSLWAGCQLLSFFKPVDAYETKFTLGQGYDIEFAPRYLLSPITFAIVK